MQLNWIKYTSGKWCQLNSLALDNPHFDRLAGVYVIWHGGKKPATVRVGKGNIRDRLAHHKNDWEIQAYKELGLYVTWAAATPEYHEGIESYLARKLKPMVRRKISNARPIEVNLPWEKTDTTVTA